MSTEKDLNVSQIIQSQAESVLTLSKNNYVELFKFTQVMVKNYLAYCFPNQVNISAQFAADLIESRPSWKAADFINVFKFFRQRQDLEGLRVMGNSITPQRLMEMVAVYEDHRAQEMELYQAKKKGEHQQVTERGQGNSMKALMGKEMDSIASKNEQLREKGYSQTYPGVADEKYFEKANDLRK